MLNQDYIKESIFGTKDMVITDPSTNIVTTAYNVIRNIFSNKGYLNGNKWETSQDRYFQDIILERAYNAVLQKDYFKADMYLALNYWNKEQINTYLRNSEEALIEGNLDKHNYCLELTYFGKDGYPCRALIFVIWKKHIELLQYILSRIYPRNITEEDFESARINDVGKYLCKKDPSRFYMDKLYFGGELLLDTPLIRTPKERADYLLQKKSKYEALAIHKYAKKTEQNIVLTGIPSDLLRYTLNMI